jgi:hypothetical protein
MEPPHLLHNMSNFPLPNYKNLSIHAHHLHQHYIHSPGIWRSQQQSGGDILDLCFYSVWLFHLMEGVLVLVAASMQESDVTLVQESDVALVQESEAVGLVQESDVCVVLQSV